MSGEDEDPHGENCQECRQKVQGALTDTLPPTVAHGGSMNYQKSDILCVLVLVFQNLVQMELMDFFSVIMYCMQQHFCSV